MKFEKEGKVGTICLNKPKALNAVNLEMIRLLYTNLKVYILYINALQCKCMCFHILTHVCIYTIFYWLIAAATINLK